MSETDKTNLLFIPYTFTNGGGAEKVLQILVNNLPLSKYTIRIQEVEQFDKYLMLNDEIKLNSAFINQEGLSKTFNELNFFLLIHFPRILKSIFRLSNYDTVIAYNYQSPSFMLPAFKNEKKIAWFHGDIYDLADNSKKEERLLQDKAWKNVDKIITISKKSQQSLIDVFPELSKKSQIIYNGINITETLQKSKEECDLSFEDKSYLVCVGRLDKNKNYILLIKALAVLKQNGINYNLVLVGTGDEKNNLVEEAEKLGISDRVYFTGYQTNPYKYISHAKLLCVTSISEGWGMVITEAMALGIPFVTTPVAGASEELADGGRCGLVAGYNPVEYAEAVKKLLTNQELYEQMSKNCIENVKQYSAENYAENFMKLLDDIGCKSSSNEKHHRTNTILDYLSYFLLYIFSIGEIGNRIHIIRKRITEKRIIKVIKNFVYLFALIICTPVFLVGKVFIFPLYIYKVRVSNR